MPNNIIDMIEPTPKLNSKKCKFISFLLRIFLQFTTFIVGFIAWYEYDYFIAISTIILSFIIMGIVRSKIRNNAIPPKQREYQYNDQGIADWFVSREICIETQNN